MRNMLLIPALAAGLLAGAGSSASAETVSAGVSTDGFYLQIQSGGPYYGGYAHRCLSPRQVRFSLRRRGFHGIRFVAERHNRYVFNAFSRRSRFVRVVVGRCSGRILRVTPLRGPGRGHHGRGHRY